MTEQEQKCLFVEMDVIAAENGKDPLWVPEDDQISFIRLVRSKPELNMSREQRDKYFEDWRRHQLAKLRLERLKVGANLMAADHERRRLLFGGKEGGRALFCACGVMLEDAGDSQTMIDHRPHMIAAGIIRGD
ncbi:hypothetical protein ACIPUD_27950 [Bradyrhizobium sp. CAR08]